MTAFHKLFSLILLPVLAFALFILAMLFGDSFKWFCIFGIAGIVCLVAWRNTFNKL